MSKKESVGKCVICGVEHFREHVELWYYHDSRGVVCRNHPGVEQWYQSLIKAAEKELNEK